MKIFGEELVIKMWDSFIDKGIGGILKPAQEKRLGKARLEIRREELLLLAQAEVYVKKIASGEAIYSDGKIKLLCSDSNADEDARVEPYIGDLSIATLAATATTCEAIQREVNVAKAILHAEHELSESEAIASDKEIEKDWLFTWRDHAGKVSSEELQSLWGKVLAGEVKQPGSYSLRTMEFLKCISKSEAQLIEKAAAFVASGVIFRKCDSYFEANGLKFSNFLFLQSIGLLSGVEASGLSVNFKSATTEKFVTFIIAGKKIVIVTDPDANKKLNLETYSVTALGKEIFKLSGAEVNYEYLYQVSQTLLKQAKTVIIADYSLGEDGEGRYTNEVEVKPQTENRDSAATDN